MKEENIVPELHTLHNPGQQNWPKKDKNPMEQTENWYIQ